MNIFKHADDLSGFLKERQKQGFSIGFVPTMGALHRGHISLIKESISKNQITVCSIFVNPLQFNDTRDYEKYPITTEADILMLEESGCQVLFLPGINDIYPNKNIHQKPAPIGQLENVLEGAFRPGHFAGVYTVVYRLLKIVMPSNLYLGQKDYQQYLIIKNMADRKFKNVCVIDYPIIREESGLALSSRNRRLNKTEIKTASELYKSLKYIKQHISPGNWHSLKREQIKKLTEKGFKVEYLELADKYNLSISPIFKNKKKGVLIIAAWIGGVRLIDNIFL